MRTVMPENLVEEVIAYALSVISTSFARYFVIAGVAFLLFSKLWRKRLAHRRIQKGSIKRNKILHDIRHSVSDSTGTGSWTG